MSLKAKLVSSVAAFCLVLALLVVGILATSTATVNMGGSISFTATDVYAKVQIDVEGTAANDTSDDITYIFSGNADQEVEEGETLETDGQADWTSKVWTFDTTRTITVTITVTNLDATRSLTSKFTAPEELVGNLACATTEAAASITAGVETAGTTVDAGDTLTYVMTFTIADENVDVKAAAWTASLSLENAGVPSAG